MNEISTDFFRLIKIRKSVRKFDPRPVEKEKIEKILECDRLAPSWANGQCWEFIVVSEERKKKQLAKAAGLLNRWICKAPIILVACADPSRSGVWNKMEYFLVDVGIALEHAVLAATALGLGACWVGYFKESEVKKALRIPEKIRVVALCPVGYPAQKLSLQEKLIRFIARSKKRKPLNQMIHYEKW